MHESEGRVSEINPKPIRVIKVMGDVTMVDWFIFIAISCFSILVFLSHPENLFHLEDNQFGFLIIGTLFSLPIIAVAAVLAFVQSKQNGKFRTRLYRMIRSWFKPVMFKKEEEKQMFDFKEVKQNHLHYKSMGNEGVVSIYRLDGFDPSLLEDAQMSSLLDNFTQLFSVNLRFKIFSTKITYTIPMKKINNTVDYFGINFATNRYIERITEINNNENLKQQAYFIILDSVSIAKNEENANVIRSSLDNPHIGIVEANHEEISQIINSLWADSFDISDPTEKGFSNIYAEKEMVKISKRDGTSQYYAFYSYNAIPEIVSVGWLSSVINSYAFDALVDISPINPQAAAKYMEQMNDAADSIMQTKWFKRKAADTERMKIQHVRELTAQITEAVATSNVQLKEVCFYLIFRENTRKRLKEKIRKFRQESYTFNTGWTITDCKYLQRDAFINTRLHDIPALQYHKSSIGLLNKGVMSKAGSLGSDSSMTNNLPIIKAIEHKILSTSLGISYPFYYRSSIATPETWFKGFLVDETGSETSPFFDNYWKVNEMYNSYNRFYQGRNGSGKSYTANIDVVADRLDDKFIISIDPKPERIDLTKNLGGQNVIIGGNNKDSPVINIFDVLVVPSSDSSERISPLLTQYQANLSSIAVLLSLDRGNPNDKLILSVFNDVQIYVYEEIKKINIATDFTLLEKNKYPVMNDFYQVILERVQTVKDEQEKSAYQKLAILMKEHAIGISAPLFNNYTNIDWSKNRMWNLVVRDITLNYGNKNILACWIINIIRLSAAFLYAGNKVVLYIDEVHLIHNITDVLRQLDEFSRVDRSFKGALCLINQNFNSIRSTADPLKKEYYSSIFTMSQYNFFFTTGEEDVMFLVEMLSGSGQPLSLAERSFITKAGRGKSLLVMNAYDRFRVQFDISFWKDLWEGDLEPLYLQALNSGKENQGAK